MSERIEQRQDAAGQAKPPPELAIVIPTRDERDNIAPLIAKLDAALAGVAWEAVFVDDDSGDGTRDAIYVAARIDPRIRCLHRIRRRGLASAVVEGMLATTAPFIAVMDADLQHDERLLPAMLATLRAGGADLAIGSRYAEGGGVAAWSARRAGLSRAATYLAKFLLRTDLSDPMSGFFMISRPAALAALPRVSGEGFKILLDLVASSPTPLAIREFPYEFRNRTHGESKLDSLVALEYAALLIAKTLGRFAPVRFWLFAAVGAVGVIAHFAVLSLLHPLLQLPFGAAQAGATLAAMTVNFFVNNLFTYRDMRLRGWRLWSGLLRFYAVCAVGAAANVGVAQFLYGREGAAWPLAALAGILVGAVWNYAASAVLTWSRR